MFVGLLTILIGLLALGAFAALAGLLVGAAAGMSAGRGASGGLLLIGSLVFVAGAVSGMRYPSKRVRERRLEDADGAGSAGGGTSAAGLLVSAGIVLSCLESSSIRRPRFDGRAVGALQLRRHLATCADCALWVAEMAAVTSLLRETPFEPVPAEMAPRVAPKADPTCSWPAGGVRGDRIRRALPRALP